MMNKINYKKILIMLSLISILIFSTGCLLPNQDSVHNSGITGNNAQFYRGKEGVSAEYQNLNPLIYYYAGGTLDENSFSFSVKVHNEGTSYAKGATFISGYDPNILYIKGQDIKRDDGGACNIDLYQFGTSIEEWIGGISCAFQNGTYFDFNLDEGQWNADITNVGSLLNQLGIWNDPPAWIDGFDIGTGGDFMGQGFQEFSFEFDNLFNSNIQLAYHGHLLSVMIDRISPFKGGFGKEYALAADTEYFPGGEIDYLVYDAEIRDWPQGLEEYPLNLLLTNCYGYATYTSPLVCIDPQPMSDRKKVCKTGDIRLTNQGAPVAVTKIEQVNTQKKSIFTIHIKNVGDGEIIYWGDMGRCSPYSKAGILTSRNKNVVQGFEVRIEDQVLKCTPDDRKIRLNPQEEGAITCTYDLKYMNIQSAYQTPLIIEFWYGYMKTESKNIIIKKVI